MSMPPVSVVTKGMAAKKTAMPEKPARTIVLRPKRSDRAPHTTWISRRPTPMQLISSVIRFAGTP